MSENSSSTNGNSWTILTPEARESGVESVGPLAEGQAGSGCSKPVPPQTEQPDPKDPFQRSEFTDGLEEHNSVPEAPQVAPLETSDDAAVPHASSQKEPTRSATPVESLTCLTSDPEQQGEPLLNPDTDSFSDSYTHVSPSHESTLHHSASQDEDGLSHGEEKSELRKILREDSSKPDTEVSEEKGNEGDGVRRRKVSLLAPVDHRDDDEEEEGEEEPFRPPQREEDTGFSLNKCIFGAVILLGLGTIFFSGVLVDLDDEGDADVKELKNPELQKEWLNLDASKDSPPGVQPPEILERLAKESEQLAMLQAQLQDQEGKLKAAQLQVEEGTKERMRREELEAENERMRGELDKLPALQKEFEQENEKVKRESERAKKDLEALSAMQKELGLLRDKVTELAQSTDGAQAVPPLSASVTPSAGHEREVPATQGRKERKDKKPQEKVREKKEKRKESKQGKEWEKDRGVKEGKPLKEGGREGKDRKKQKKDEGEEWRPKGDGKPHKDEKEGKKGEKHEDGKRWKDSEAKRELNEEGGKRDRKEDDKRWKDGQVKGDIKEEGDKKWKKEKRWQLDGARWETKEGKHSKDKVKKDKELKHGDLKDGNDEKEWKRGRQVGLKEKEERKEKNERKKDWKERGEWDGEKEHSNPKAERKGWKENTWKGEKDHHKANNGKKEWKEREDKHWSGKEKERSKDGDRAEGWKEGKKHKGEYQKSGEKWSKKDKSRQDKASHHSYSDRKLSEDHVHDNYWADQRERIRHYRGSTEGCNGVTACAHAEGLTPVSRHDFDALLLSYLTKLLGPEGRASKTEELNKLIGEFFSNGVFVHDQIPFGEFVEDVADILEDLAEEEQDEQMEDEMEEFAKEAIEKFALTDRAGNEEKKKESRRKRSSG